MANNNNSDNNNLIKMSSKCNVAARELFRREDDPIKILYISYIGWDIILVNY